MHCRARGESRAAYHGYAAEPRSARLGITRLCEAEFAADQSDRRSALRRRSALPITEAELRLIASAAIIGDSSQPVNGNSTPAASGTPSAF